MLERQHSFTAGQNETAAYVRDMALELHRMCMANGYDLLAYLLRMAAEEAETEALGPGVLGGRKRDRAAG